MRNPTLATTYVQLSILYATMGRLDEALDVLVRGRKVNPLWALLPATEIFVRLCRREFDSAADYGRKAVDLYPYLQLGRAFFAQALEFSGRTEEALAEYRYAGVMSPDLPWLRALEATCLAKNGRAGEASKILEELNQIRAATYVDAYYMALLLDALGNREPAFQELERAAEENSTMLYILDVDPKLDSLRDDPRFLPLREKAVWPGRESASMKAMVLRAPGDLALNDVEPPQVPAGHVLVRITHSGLCGTDLKIYRGAIPAQYPLIMGHEMVGEAAGGARVIIDPVLYCGTCFHCRIGQNQLMVPRAA